ncbi:MAG: ImmA/IrrE family metallo-endopeptidase [Deltaproteobacteria bacterium]|nr:ImmA/IrrE family metallo-endopeptidase [Deltaproteobacteria bacterium]
MATADVRGDVLRWARESAGLDVEAVAKRLKVKPDTVAAWEEAGARLPVVRLREVAQVCKRPIAALLLARPPAEPPGPADFRTVPDAERKALSPRTIVALRRARRVQRLARELASTTRLPFGPQLDRVSLSDDPNAAATTVRQALGITFDQQRSWRSASQALRRWSQAVERRGVLVVQASMAVEEIRGVSLGDVVPPVVVVSTKDPATARCFSLFHELGHVLLASPGMCDPFADESASATTTDKSSVRCTEVFCNRFAGAILVPEVDLRGIVGSRADGGSWSDERLGALADAFCVSREAMLLRLVSLGGATPDFYRRKREQWRAASRVVGPRHGPKPAQRCLRNNGAAFVALTLEAHERGAITRRDVGDYLAIQLRHMAAVENLLRGGATL